MLNFSLSSGLAGSILKVNSAAATGNRWVRPAPCTSGIGASVVAEPIADTISVSVTPCVLTCACAGVVVIGVGATSATHEWDRYVMVYSARLSGMGPEKCRWRPWIALYDAAIVYAAQAGRKTVGRQVRSRA